MADEDPRKQLRANDSFRGTDSSGNMLVEKQWEEVQKKVQIFRIEPIFPYTAECTRDKTSQSIGSCYLYECDPILSVVSSSFSVHFM
jgi:hypothetical protein